jgi:hypothetical protein
MFVESTNIVTVGQIEFEIIIVIIILQIVEYYHMTTIIGGYIHQKLWR